MTLPLATYIFDDLKATELHKGVYQIEHFLKEEEIKYLRTLAETTTSEGWKKRNHDVLRAHAAHVYGEEAEAEIQAYIDRNHTAYWDDKLIQIPDEDFCQRINDRLAPFFDGLYDLPYLEEIQRQYEGVGLDEHVDSDYDHRVRFAVVMYINDDFTGGELYFPTQGLEIKPVAGSCLIFSTGAEYLHGVRPVGAGPGRYAMAGFAWELGTKEAWLDDH